MNLGETGREELMSMQRSRTMAIGQVKRARLISLLDEGAPAGGDHGRIALRFALYHDVANAFHK
jgi:hypothetical protein